MKTSTKYTQHAGEGHELELPCGKCRARTFHRVVCSAGVESSHEDLHNFHEWWVENQIVQCQGCKTFSFRTVSGDSEDRDYDDDGQLQPFVTESLYPPRMEGVGNIGFDLWWLPPPLKAIYEESLKALTGGLPVLAAIGMRALLEGVCKEKQAKGDNLYYQIEDLASRGVLNPQNAKILHKVRALGNEAAHELTAQKASQLGLAMNILEHLLKDVYINPRLYEQEFPATPTP
ncbi:DUF4145 domain-containing protein [Pseudomonas monteilii]|uniref:DUF4145 domain-containing protein n=1 Tax=Pseudomonas monteilii TaxID=76759 RepID=UPI001E36E170|nr:DUF4145 domain-containing protein [Pseudomonas monteilii]MCE0877167.1 DUF4145 domain-containing protein [Pseudomonas monteilii]MCE0929323.1 DUF4145 domain-containing protein [Pseudomonas monteilii]MCE0935072.1 DUF4145 domain-containing protein [Pseudomonas monteilii]MCE1015597.1 DUF4145 domain-containing protein [Pseudomonas monteilii]MCE1044294.1 DUF4145 domain-containing protein [Pseudomonas monteilii]